MCALFLPVGPTQGIPLSAISYEFTSFNNDGDHMKDLNDYSREAHAANLKWWYDIRTGERIERNKGELLALIHSEVSECLEGVRKNLMDDKLPHRTMEEVELADTLIRIFDYAGGFGLDLEGAYLEKMAFNAQRTDHTHEHRLSGNGKKF